MDVEYLAPSLLALSSLVHETNAYANGNRASIKVFVNTDLEQNCFELNIETVQTAWEQTKSLIENEDVVVAKEILEWIGILSGLSVAASLGLYQFIKWIKGKKINPVKVIQDDKGQNMMEISVKDESELIVVTQFIYDLYSKPAIRQKAVDVLEPLRKEGFNRIEFYSNNSIHVSFSSDDVPNADASDLPDLIPQNVHSSNIQARVRIRKAVYEGTSKWTIVYNKRAEDVSIDDTEWLELFQTGQAPAPPGSSLDVELEQTYMADESGRPIGEPSYKILKVYGVQDSTEKRQLNLDLKH